MSEFAAGDINNSNEMKTSTITVIGDLNAEQNGFTAEESIDQVTATYVGSEITCRQEKSLGHRAVSWGCGEFGQHGHDVTQDVNIREGEITHPSLKGRIKMAACGSSHTIVVTDDDQIYTWGNGSSGQLGNSDLVSKYSPTLISLEPPPPDDVKVVSVQCGSRHTMVVLSNGHLYSFGNNFYAQLGYDFRKENYKENQSTPCLVQYLVYNPVMAVSCGDKHSLILFKDGTVTAVGNNSHGQIGDGDRAESVVPKPVDLDIPVRQIAAGNNHNLVVSDTGDVYVWGYCRGCGHRKHDVLSPELKLKGRSVIQLAAGSTHSLALTNSGDVYTWGFGTEGQLGQGEGHVALATPRVIRHQALRHRVSYISAGESISAAVTVDGQLYMWGKDSHVIVDETTEAKQHFHPVCMSNGYEGPGFHSVECGSWHAVALIGEPDFRPTCDDDDLSDDSGSDPDDQGMTSESDDLSVTDSEGKQMTITLSETDAFGNTGPIEKSMAPVAHHSGTTSPDRKMTSLGMPMRTQTKLTLGEFYAMSDGSGQSHVTSPRSAASGSSSQKMDEVDGDIQQDTKSSSGVVHVPSDAGDPENTDTEDQRGEEVTEDMETLQVPLSPRKSESSSSSSSMVSESSLKKRMAENIKANTGLHLKATKNLPSNHPFRRKTPPVRPSVAIHVVTNPDREAAARSHNGGSSRHGVGDRAHTMFISKTTANNFSLPRERSFITKQSMSLVDLQELRAGSIFDVAEDESTDNAMTPLQGNSNCSSRMELLTPGVDLELQEIFGQKTPEKMLRSPTNVVPPSASDTPSALARQMRTREMMGSGASSSTFTPTLTTPSPANGLLHRSFVNNDPTMGLMRSKTLLGPLGRSPNRHYRKPGLPGGRAPPAKGQQRQMASIGLDFQHSLGGMSKSTGSINNPSGLDTSLPSLELQTHQPSFTTPRSLSTLAKRPGGLSSGFSTPPANPCQLLIDPVSTPPSTGRIRGVHSQPDPIQTSGNSYYGNPALEDIAKRRAVYSSATSWRKRMNTTLGTSAVSGKESMSNIALTGIGARTKTEMKVDGQSATNGDMNQLNGHSYQQSGTSAGLKSNVSLTPTRKPKASVRSKTSAN